MTQAISLNVLIINLLCANITLTLRNANHTFLCIYLDLPHPMMYICTVTYCLLT